MHPSSQVTWSSEDQEIESLLTFHLTRTSEHFSKTGRFSKNIAS